MLTGTPLDLTPLGSLMGSIGFIYWALAALVGIQPQQFDEADYLNARAGAGRTGSAKRAANEAVDLPKSTP